MIFGYRSFGSSLLRLFLLGSAVRLITRPMAPFAILPYRPMRLRMAPRPFGPYGPPHHHGPMF